MSAAGTRRLAHSRDGAPKGAVAASTASTRGRSDATEPPAGPHERPFHGEELGRRVVIVLGGGLVRDGGHALAKLLERGGERRKLGKGGTHALMMAYSRR